MQNNFSASVLKLSAICQVMISLWVKMIHMHVDIKTEPLIHNKHKGMPASALPAWLWVIETVKIYISKHVKSRYVVCANKWHMHKKCHLQILNIQCFQNSICVSTDRLLINENNQGHISHVRWFTKTHTQINNNKIKAWKQVCSIKQIVMCTLITMLRKLY